MKHPNNPNTHYSYQPVPVADLIPCHQCRTLTEKGRTHAYIDACPLCGEYGQEIYERCDGCEYRARAASRRKFARQALGGPFAFLCLLQLLGGLNTDPFQVIRTVLPLVCLLCFGVSGVALLDARYYDKKANLYVRKSRQ